MKKKKNASAGRQAQKKQAAQKKGQQQAQQPQRQSARQQPASRSSGGVPPLDAFDHVRRLPPPNLPSQPGYNPNQMPYQEQARQPQPEQTTQQNKEKKSSKAGPQGSNKRKKTGASASQANASAPKRSKPLTPARIRRNRRIAGVIAIILLIAGGIAFSVGVLFKINNFKIEGDTTYTLEELQIAFGHSVGDNLFGFSAGQTAERMEQTLPYIEKLTIKRQLPSTIVFKVQQAEETYILQTANGYAILSASRKVLRISDTAVEGLTTIIGADDVIATPGLPLQIPDSEAQANMEALISSLQTRGIEEVDQIDIQNSQAVSFKWQDRFTILVGTRIDLEKKLDFAFKILNTTGKNGFSEGDHGTLDVSKYPDNPQVIFSPE